MLAAQVTAAPGQTTSEASKSVETVPRVPGVSTLFKGFNAGVTYSAVHNSSIGWYTILTPAMSYTFSRRYSADISGSLYLHRLTENLNPATNSSEHLVVDEASAGDMLFGFHATFLPKFLLDTISVYLTAPTGDRSVGLGTGKVTFDVSNHTERYFKQLGFLLDLGVGNSSNVSNNLVNQNYSSVGGLAQFQTGAILWLPRHSYFESAAYEELPVGSQTVYTANSSQGISPQPPLSGATFAEDNGFMTFAGIPLANHLTLSGYYNHSLRRKTDTVSFGITYVIRGTGIGKHMSMIDRAIREAEQSNP